MDILNTKSLECNNKFRINFDGGNLSSDAGALLLNTTNLFFRYVAYRNQKPNFYIYAPESA